MLNFWQLGIKNHCNALHCIIKSDIGQYIQVLWCFCNIFEQCQKHDHCRVIWPKNNKFCTSINYETSCHHHHHSIWYHHYHNHHINHDNDNHDILFVIITILTRRTNISLVTSWSERSGESGWQVKLGEAVRPK